MLEPMKFQPRTPEPAHAGQAQNPEQFAKFQKAKTSYVTTVNQEYQGQKRTLTDQEYLDFLNSFGKTTESFDAALHNARAYAEVTIPSHYLQSDTKMEDLIEEEVQEISLEDGQSVMKRKMKDKAAATGKPYYQDLADKLVEVDADVSTVQQMVANAAFNLVDTNDKQAFFDYAVKKAEQIEKHDLGILIFNFSPKGIKENQEKVDRAQVEEIAHQITACLGEYLAFNARAEMGNTGLFSTAMRDASKNKLLVIPLFQNYDEPTGITMQIAMLLGKEKEFPKVLAELQRMKNELQGQIENMKKGLGFLDGAKKGGYEALEKALAGQPTNLKNTSKLK